MDTKQSARDTFLFRSWNPQLLELEGKSYKGGPGECRGRGFGHEGLWHIRGLGT